MACKILTLLLVLSLAAGCAASRDLKFSLKTLFQQVAAPTVDCAVPFDADSLRAFVAKIVTDKDAAWASLTDKYACKLSPLVDRAVANDARALGALRVLYDLWRLTYKPEQWRRPLAGEGNGSSARFDTWLTNLQTILSVNAAQLPYKVALNFAADMSWPEFQASMLHGRLVRPTQADHAGWTDRRRKLLAPGPGEEVEEEEEAAPTYPTAVDWAAAGKVTPAGFQGQCASGWVFSAIGALESKLLINTPAASNTSVDLSEQQALECVIPTLGAPGFGNCTGGYPANVFQFAALNGSVTERLYPYTGRNTTGCKASMVAGLLKQRSADLVVAAAPAPAYARVGQGRVAYMQALAQQPIAAFIGMDPTFQFYYSGVYNGGTFQRVLTVNRNPQQPSICTVQTVHVVLVTGYDTAADAPAFIIRNSWGQSWGQDGFARVAMIPGSFGTCGLYQYGYYPTTTTTLQLPATKSNGKGVSNGKA